VNIHDHKGSGGAGEEIVLNLNGGSAAKGGEQINIGISQTSSGERILLSFGNSGGGSSAGATPNVLLNLGSTPSEIDIAVSQTSAGEQIAISFGDLPSAKSAASAFANGTSGQTSSSGLSVSA
jgi:hypothetical protein